MALPPKVERLLQLYMQRSSQRPTMALSHALQLDRELAANGWTEPLTYSAHGYATPEVNSDTSAPKWETAPPHSIRTLYDATALAKTQGGPSAQEHGYRKARGKEIAALNILYANQSLESDRHWLHFMNKYLAHWSGEGADSTERLKIGLAPNGPNRFARLISAAPTPKPVTDGPLVSVLMPAYNAAKTIKMAAESILAQSWRNLELIIIDDCSTDSTILEAEKIRASDSRVRILRQSTNRGNYPAKNKGARHAKGQFITVHDADDWATPTRIAAQVAPLLNNSKLKATVTRMMRMTTLGTVTRVQPLDNITPDGYCRLCFPSLLIDIEYFRNSLGAWDSVRFGADQEILQRIARFEPEKLQQIETIAMLQLDAAGSLTTSTETYSDERGESAARTKYREKWRKLHASATGLPKLCDTKSKRMTSRPTPIK